jgi:putative transposase
VSYAFIRNHVVNYPIQVMCEVLGVSRSGYYDWASRPESARAVEDRAVAAEIRTAHEASRGRYGSPRVHAALRAHGRRVGRKRVARLMRGMGLSARRKRRFRRTTDSAHAFPVAPNLLGRDFTARAPDRVWLADLTTIWTAEGWLYLAVVLDLFSRRVVGWAMATTSATSWRWPPSTWPLSASVPRRVSFTTRIAACNSQRMGTASDCASTASFAP